MILKAALEFCGRKTVLTGDSSLFYGASCTLNFEHLSSEWVLKTARTWSRLG